MQRYCFTMTIRPGQEAEYERRHQEVWPELVTALRENGVSNYSLFRQGNRVIAYAECEPDGPTAFGAVARTDVDARWAAWFEDVLEPLADDEGNLETYREVWHMPEQTPRS